MLNLESTSSRMSHLARQEIYFDRQFGLDETLEGVERGDADDVQRVARRSVRATAALAATVLGRASNGLEIPRRDGWHCSEGVIDDSAVHPPRDGSHLERPAAVRDLAAGRAGRGRGDGPRRHRARRGRARHPRARRVRHRPHRRDRSSHPARRDRVHDRGGRARRPVGALAALRPDVVRRHRHRAGAADARGVRPDPEGPRRADGGGARRAPRSIAARR